MRPLLSTFLGGLLAMNMSLPPARAAGSAASLWDHDNLFAWCAVPFDAKGRGPEERAAMLARLGFKSFAYDWRAKDIPTFDAEIDALQKRHIKLSAWWFSSNPADPANKQILEACKRHNIHPQMWVAWGGPFTKTPEEQRQRIEQMASNFKALDALAKPYGCQVEIYNHNGWGGNEDNELAVLARLKEMGVSGMGLVYNFSHAYDHDHNDMTDFPALWKRIQEHVVAVNVTGMGLPDGTFYPSTGKGELEMMRTIEESGWRGPVGLIAESGGDAEVTLANCLKGLDWLQAELKAPGSAGNRPFPLVAGLDGAAAAASATPVAGTGLHLVPNGKFGKALDAATGGFITPNSDDIRHGPLTVELWARLHDANSFNVLVASDPKSSGEHWEIYSYAGTGNFSAYLPGRTVAATPGEIVSSTPICDDAWHYLAMTMDASSVKLYVDGSMVMENSALQPAQTPAIAGDLAIGQLVEGGFNCNGLIDDVRISKELLEIPGTPPAKPFTRSGSTLGLWNFDDKVAGLGAETGLDKLTASLNRRLQ